MLSQESHPISSQFLRFAIVLGVAICLAFPPSVSCLECNCDPVPRRLGDPDLVQIMFHGSFSNTSAEKINNISDRTFLEVHKHTKHGQYVWRTVTQSSTDQCIESTFIERLRVFNGLALQFRSSITTHYLTIDHQGHVHATLENLVHHWPTDTYLSEKLPLDGSDSSPLGYVHFASLTHPAVLHPANGHGPYFLHVKPSLNRNGKMAHHLRLNATTTLEQGNRFQICTVPVSLIH